MTTSALNEYRERRAARAAEHARHARHDARVSYSRLAVVAAFALTAWLVLGAGFTAWSFAVPVFAFGALAVWHDRVLRALDRAVRAVTFYDHGLARLEDKWQIWKAARPQSAEIEASAGTIEVCSLVGYATR